MRRYIILFLFIIISYISLPIITSAKTISSQGVVVIENNDIVSAKNNALNDAFTKAISEVINDIMPEGSVNDNIILEKIYSNPVKYIEEYKVIREYSSENIYYLDIEVNVSEKSIYNDLINLGIIKKEIEIVEITINNVYKYSYFSEILSTIKGMIMVKEVRYKSFIKGSATIEVDIIGNPEKFIEMLRNLKFNEFDIRINQVGRRVIFNIISS
jgi:hypothetical protein